MGYGQGGGGGYGGYNGVGPQRQGGYGGGGERGGGGGQPRQGGNDRPKKEWPLPTTFDEAKNYRVNFGQFKGTTLNVMATSDRGLTYIHWLSENVDAEKYKDTAAALDLFVADERVQKAIEGALSRKGQEQDDRPGAF